MNVREFLSDRIRSAMSDAGVPADCQPHLTPSKKAQIADYQANGAMAAAKRMKINPRELAQEIVNNLVLDGISQQVEVAGPGFINIRLSTSWLSQQIESLAAGTLLVGLENDSPNRVLIDYSSPNLAKEMHVGHLRSTIIGDCIARVMEYLGEDVIRQNHVGDWGTQFGMLVAELEESLADEQADLALNDLETFYQQAKQHFDSDEAFATRARDYVVKLQSGDQKVLQLWEKFRKISLQHSENIYQKLGVTLQASDVRGESFYNPHLADIIADLKTKKLVVKDEGAQVCFLNELADKNGNPSPVIVQKKDGGYLYATTDLAALRYRVDSLKADRILVFTDARQSLHMQQVFTLARKAEFVDEWVTLEHLTFGTMMGKDGKPFKTRTGGTIKLNALLDESVSRAAAVVREKNSDLDEKQIQEVAHKVGIGAIKYADLSKTRTHDYIFDWDAMLSFEGNTGPYLQYAYTRICSIFRKAEIDMANFSGKVALTDSLECGLALKNLQLVETLELVIVDCYPHQLCNYLHDLASSFMSFYENCPILKEGISPETRESRLQLSKVTGQTLKKGLELLGIDVMERM